MTPVIATGLSALAARKGRKEVVIDGIKLNVLKLSVKQITEIQSMADEQTKQFKASQEEGSTVEAPNELDQLKFIIKLGVEGGAELTDEVFGELAVADLKTLSEEIMAYNGLAEGK